MVDVISHRGASSLALENSMEAFEKAIELRSDIIELDIRKCATGELIVMHDMKVNRTTKSSGYVKKKTLSQIKDIVMINGEHIPTLEEVLDFVKGKCRLNVEIKSALKDYDLADTLIELIRRKKMEDSVAISSFNHKLLKYTKEKAPEIKTFAIFVDAKKPSTLLRRMHYIGAFVRRAKWIKADAMNLPYQFITRKLVKSAMMEGLKVNAWTVNSDKKIEKMKLLGVDGIITDYPQKFLNIKERDKFYSKNIYK